MTESSNNQLKKVKRTTDGHYCGSSEEREMMTLWRKYGGEKKGQPDNENG